MQQRLCPFCGSNNLALLETGRFQCQSCGQQWQLQDNTAQPATVQQPDPQLVTRRRSIGKLTRTGNGVIYDREQIDEETENGMNTTITRSFNTSGAGYLVHEDKEIIGCCSQCKSLVHASEAASCEYHSSRELLCGNCRYEFNSRTMCRRAYIISITTTILLFPIKLTLWLTGQVLSLLFLKE